MKTVLKKIFQSPWLILFALAAGVLTGLTAPSLIPTLKQIGNIYVTLLKMCVIPIIMSAVVISFGKLFRSDLASSFLIRMVLLFTAAMFSIALIGPVISFITPGMLTPNDEIKSQLSDIVLENSGGEGFDEYLGFKAVSFSEETVTGKSEPLFSAFLSRLIPDNIFQALSQGETLKVVLFFSFFGISLTLIPGKASGGVLLAMEGIYKASQWMVKKILLLFPIGLWALTAGQFSDFGFSLVSSLTKLLLFIFLSTLIIITATLLIIRIRTRKPMVQILRAVKEMMIIALGTRNSFAAVPSGIRGLTEELGFESYRVEGPFTLGVTLCRHGNILVISIAALFAFRLYAVPLTLPLILYISTASLLAAAAGSGAPGIIARSMVGVVLVPVGIPAEIIILMLQAIDPIIDPFTTLLNVLPNFGAAALLGNTKQKGVTDYERAR